MPLVVGFARLLLAWALVAVGLGVISRLAEPRRALAGRGVTDADGEARTASQFM